MRQRPFSPHGPRSDRWDHCGCTLGSPGHGVRRAGWPARRQWTVRKLRTAPGLRAVRLFPTAGPRTDGDRCRLDGDGDRAPEQRERYAALALGGDACAARRWHLHPRRSATRRVRGEFLVATGPFGLRHRGGSGDRGQPVGKNPRLQRERGHVLPAHRQRDRQPWQDPGTNGARCSIVDRVHGALASVRTALACGAHSRRTGHHGRQLVRPVRPRRRRDRHGSERPALVEGPQGRNPRPRQPGLQLVGGCAGVLCRIDRRGQGHGRPTWLCGRPEPRACRDSG